jgi:hypothetical protein
MYFLCSSAESYPKQLAADTGNAVGQGRGSEISILIIFPPLYLVAATTDLPIRTIIFNYSDQVRGGVSDKD